MGAGEVRLQGPAVRRGRAARRGQSVGANHLALDRLGGLAAETADDWVDAIASILDATPAARREFGAGALQGVERHYSFSTWAATWSRAVHG